jgi:hypothetical protein
MNVAIRRGRNESDQKTDTFVDGRLVEDDVLADALEVWCSNTNSVSNSLHALEAKLDDVMERYLSTENEFREHPSDEVSREALESLGEDALKLQHTIHQLQDGQKSSEAVSQCLASLINALPSNIDPNRSKTPTGGIINTAALQMWILLACQVPDRGGLRDKPGTISRLLSHLLLSEWPLSCTACIREEPTDHHWW